MFYKTRTKDSQACGVVFGDTGGKEIGHELATHTSSPESQLYPSSEVWPAGQSNSPSLLTLRRSLIEYYIQIWGSQYREVLALLEQVPEGHQNGQKAGTFSLWEKVERIGFVQPGEEKNPGRCFCHFSICKSIFWFWVCGFFFFFLRKMVKSQFKF